VSTIARERIQADTRARRRNEKPIAELEKVAYSDVRDLVAWDMEPIFDVDGAVTGYRDRMTVTPSHRLKSGVGRQLRALPQRAAL
jgi:hypothetical protein